MKTLLIILVLGIYSMNYLKTDITHAITTGTNVTQHNLNLLGE